jgi:predicted acylesterase/phospholipase RssA
VSGEPDVTEVPAGTRTLLDLRRMESALVRASLDHPDVIAARDVRRLRYLLSFARLTRFAPAGRDDVDISDEVAAMRTRVVDELTGPLREEKDVAERLRATRTVLEKLVPVLEETRAAVVARHEADFSSGELDAEVGQRVFISVAGGGGGAGYVYIGAYRRLEEAGIVPRYVIGSSFGALMGIFRARAAAADWDAYVEFAKTLDRRELFLPLSIRRRFGLPGLLYLNLAAAIGPEFVRGDGEQLRISDLDIPYEAVVAGVRRRSFDRLPRRFRTRGTTTGQHRPEARRSPARVGVAVAARMWQVAAFFDPRIVKPVVLGADDATAELNAIDAAGFSAAIPGVLHYDVGDGDERTAGILQELFEREDLAALVDGGVTANVPAELAWRRVQAGKLGTRNVFSLAFDCFHPQWDPGQLWLQPITQGVQLQMVRNAPFADWVLRIEPTLSPLNLVPQPEQVDQATEWGRASIEPLLPMIRRFLEPVSWED